MDIVFVRHGIAEDFAVSDDARALTIEGREKIALVARFLAEKVDGVDLVMASPLVRAQQTAEIIASHLPAALFRTEPELHYDTLPDDTLSMLARVARDAQTAICVGHEPNLSSVISLALAGGYGSFVRVNRGTAASISFPSSPEKGKGMLNWFCPVGVLKG